MTFTQISFRDFTHVITFFLFSGFLFLGISLPAALAQPSKVQSGEIEMEFHDEKVEDPYSNTKLAVLNKLKKFHTDLTQHSFEAPPLFEDEELTFLAAVYLHCTLRGGACTLVPFTLFETDLVRALNQESPTCPNLVRFWKAWIGADMEKRVDLNLGVAHYEKRTNYKSKIRPRLLKCSQTVSEMYKKTEGSKRDFLLERFKPGAEKAKLPKLLFQYVIEIHKKISNIYRETGVRG